jgi:SAM-dependent methyltransferase
MGLLSRIKDNSCVISDLCAGSRDYFELATTNLSLYRHLCDAAHDHIRGRLLDAGAGRMAYRSMLMARCDSYESFDIAEGAGIDHVGDLQDTGLPDDTYDSVFCTQVLHHLPEPEQALGEMARMLKPGGNLVLSVPHLVWLHNEPHDYYRFTAHSLRHLLAKVGLQEVDIHPAGGLLCFLAYAPSTFALAALLPVKPLFRLGLWLNRLFIRAALCVDGLIGVKSLYPTNYIVVARKPE